jgi:hypothetical protein
MSKLTEYLKLIPKGLSNPKQVLEGWMNDYNFDNLKPNEVKEILNRRAVCESCPLNSINAKTSKEYKDLFDLNYFTDRDDLHCSICACPISTKTAALSSSCGLETYNENNPNNPQTLKWNKYNETTN